MKIAKESWVIMAIGLADLITTIIFIQNHGAEEANPLFKRYWEMGLLVFILAKLALLVGPLWVLEWARKRNPSFVSWALRSGIAAYLIMYGVGFARLNSPAAHASELATINVPAPDSPMAKYVAYRGDTPDFHRQPRNQRFLRPAVCPAVKPSPQVEAPIRPTMPTAGTTLTHLSTPMAY